MTVYTEQEMIKRYKEKFAFWNHGEEEAYFHTFIEWMLYHIDGKNLIKEIALEEFIKTKKEIK